VRIHLAVSDSRVDHNARINHVFKPASDNSPVRAHRLDDRPDATSRETSVETSVKTTTTTWVEHCLDNPLVAIGLTGALRLAAARVLAAAG
jgi:hypothetical protein